MISASGRRRLYAGEYCAPMKGAAAIEEVKWELDIRGFGNVNIYVSGGINEDKDVCIGPA